MLVTFRRVKGSSEQLKKDELRLISMSAHSNSVCFRYRGARCNEGAYSVGALAIVNKNRIEGALTSRTGRLME